MKTAFVRLECSRCEAQEEVRGIGEQLPPGWCQLRVEVQEGGNMRLEQYELCPKCWLKVRLVIGNENVYVHAMPWEDS